jgi:hypothetical protein
LANAKKENIMQITINDDLINQAIHKTGLDATNVLEKALKLLLGLELPTTTTDKQINHWAKIGKIAEENPDLSFEFIQSVLEAKQEALNGQTEPYLFG